MKKTLIGFVIFLFSSTILFSQSDLVISGAIDGPLTGGIPKAIELYVLNDIADLSIYAVGSANNGGGTDGEEFTFPADAALAGTYIYVASETTGFTTFFGFAPDYSTSYMAINGDDAVELFQNGTVVDVFGDINTDGSGQPWDHLDGWAYRVDNTGPDGTIFTLANWTFSGINALDGETTNATATTPFPNGTYTAGPPVDNPPTVSSTTPTDLATGITLNVDVVITFSEDVTVSGSWYSISGATSGAHTAVVSGTTPAFTLNPDSDFAEGEVVTVTIVATQVADQDGTADNMASNHVFSFTTANPSSGWIINELLADPAADLPGDANGDGVRHFSDDEFVELVNATGGAVDISGWTLSDGAVRHTFPTGTILPDQSAIVIFGGGIPMGVFGKALVQTSTTGNLGLSNSGDTVILNNGAIDVASYTYGGEGGNNQSITRDPDITGSDPLVHHSTATGSGGVLFSPGTMIDGSPFTGAYIAIFEIQGSSMIDPYASPFNTQIVMTAENIVTAVGPDGFCIQTQTTRSDNNGNTSDGLFVYTGAVPTVAVGDMLNVTATVDEYYELTELVTPTILPAGIGIIPVPIIFDANTPSPLITQSVIEFERFEGMLVAIVGGVVNAPNQSFGTDPIAEVYITAGTSRVFRETGIEGVVWDGNPEIFEMDPDRMGLPNITINGGSTFSATGVIGYEYGDYELWPTALVVLPTNLLTPVSGGNPSQFSVSALNLYRLFDDVTDGGEEIVPLDEYNLRLAKLSLYIRNVLDSPDILAVSEVEKLAVLQTLANKIATDDPSIVYTAYLEEGNDVGGIDVGFLVQENRVQVDAVTQLGGAETWVEPSGSSSLLHDRPPLLLEGSFQISTTPYVYTPISVIALHIRSMGGIDTERVQLKRLNQAQSIAQMVQDLQVANPDINLIVIGDMNAFEFTDGYVDVLGQIRGEVTPGDNVHSAPVITNPILINTTTASPTAAPKIFSPLADALDRVSFIYQGSAQTLDHALVSSHLAPEVTNQEFGSGNADAAIIFADDPTTPLRSSDHDGLVIYINAIDLALPVELSSFIAKATTQGVQINWRTESEIENLGFIIERKVGDATWKEIVSYKTDDELLGQGTVSYATNYQFTDKVVQQDITYEYRLADVDYNGIVTYHGIREVTVEYNMELTLPNKYELGINYPNPFNPSTTINYSLPEESLVTITIFDISGRQISTLINAELSAGYHSISWNSTDDNGNALGAGIYFYSINAGDFRQTRKMLLIK